MNLVALYHKQTRREVKRAIPAVFFCCWSVLLSAQNPSQVQSTDRQHLLGGQFELISKTESIPASIKEAFARVSRESSFAMANPGQKYQVGDVVLDRNLPFRRLMFAGSAGDRWFIHYERGGRGHGYYVVVFKVGRENKPQLLWGGSGGIGAKSLAHLRNMIADGEISRTTSY
jgi:hypothetical protein